MAKIAKVRRLASEGSWISLVIGLTAFLVFGASLFMTLQTNKESVSMIVSALKALVQNPNQQAIGLEALVKSVLPSSLTEQIENAPIPESLVPIIASVEAGLSSPIESDISSLCAAPEARPTIKKSGFKGITKKRLFSSRSPKQETPNHIFPSDFVRISKVNGPMPVDEYVTEKPEVSSNLTFLYVPGALVRAKPGTAADLALPSDWSVASDVQKTRSLSRCFVNLDGLSILPSSPSEIVQAFIITSRGIIRLRELGSPDQRTHYEDQFEPLLYFARPYYFRHTVKRDVALKLKKPPLDKSTKINQAFTVTEPYIDLGGNGVVSTICRPMKTLEERDSVFCMDISLAEIAEPKIKEKLGSLGRIWEGECGVQSSGTPECDDVFGGDKKVLEDEITTLKSDSKESDLFGGIKLVPSEVDKLTFIVPLSPLRHGNSNGNKRRILMSQIDLKRLRFNLLLWPFLSLGSAALFVFNLVFSVADYRRRLSVQEATLDRVADVMSAARDAYCRVTQEDKFIDLNDAFARLLGFDNRNECQEALGVTTFLDLLDDESRKKYIEKTRQRLDRQTVEPYEINLRQFHSGSWVKATVHGAAVPLPMGPRRSSQTFGILLS